MPRFKFETPAALKPMLEALGMKQAFLPGAADFSGMDGTRTLYIQAVLHKAFIAVAEKGTEAAAATAVVAGRTSAPLDVLRLTVDRPFLFFLRDEPTGAILFMGRVVDPR
jgi:serpin B